MSARLNMKAIRYVNWKGKTFQQVSSSIIKNNPAPNSASSIRQIMKPLPLKIYRREIAVEYPEKSCSVSRFSSSVDELLRPNGSIVRPYSASDSATGIIGTLDFNYNENRTENYGCVAATSAAKCAETDARKRVRSSGMIRKKFDPLRQETAYFTNSTQYLTSRSKTFHQNQYQHVRRNEISIVSPQNDAIKTFVSNGSSHCPKLEISQAKNNNRFFYLWIDYDSSLPDPVATYLHEIVIPDGVYDVGDLNGAVERALIANEHYYVNNANFAKVPLIKFIYNVVEKKVELQLYSSATVDNADYSVPIDVTWTNPSPHKIPVVFIPSGGFETVVGFNTGYYPDILADSGANERSTNYGVVSNKANKLTTSYKELVYKPSNATFASQGGVSSGERTLRAKYNNITGVGKMFKSSYSMNMSSALAYGVGGNMYTVKDKIGYRMTKTPVFDKVTGVKTCVEYKSRKYCRTEPVPEAVLGPGTLDIIAANLRQHMTEFRNTQFWAYRCDGDISGNYIRDGGNDMYDVGNFVTPWLLSGERFDIGNDELEDYPYCVNYSTVTQTVVDTDFNYVSLGWIYEIYNGEEQTEQSRHPITLLGFRNSGPVGWQIGGELGADGGGNAISGYVYNGAIINGFTVYTGYRQVYNANDPTICNLCILLGHSSWGSVFGPITLVADDSDTDYSKFLMYSGAGSQNILTVYTLLSRDPRPNDTNDIEIPTSELETIVGNFITRIAESLGM